MRDLDRPGLSGITERENLTSQIDQSSIDRPLQEAGAGRGECRALAERPRLERRGFYSSNNQAALRVDLEGLDRPGGGLRRDIPLPAGPCRPAQTPELDKSTDRRIESATGALGSTSQRAGSRPRPRT